MNKYTRRLGSDQVEFVANRLVIITPTPMPGWEVRKYRAPLIRYDGRTWRITDRIELPDKSIRFELVSWEPGEGEIPGPQIDYSPESVALRDQALQIGRRRNRGTMWLNYAGPLIGFLPSHSKARIEATYGIDPVTATKWSILIEFLVCLGGFVMSSIGAMVIALGYPSPFAPLLFVAIGVLAGVDAGVRYGRVLSEDRRPPGVYEWLFSRRS